MYSRSSNITTLQMCFSVCMCVLLSACMSIFVGLYVCLVVCFSGCYQSPPSSSQQLLYFSHPSSLHPDITEPTVSLSVTLLVRVSCLLYVFLVVCWLSVCLLACFSVCLVHCLFVWLLPIIFLLPPSIIIPPLYPGTLFLLRLLLLFLFQLVLLASLFNFSFVVFLRRYVFVDESSLIDDTLLRESHL